VLWGKAARATRVVSSGMALRGWGGRDRLLSFHHIERRCLLPADGHWNQYLPSKGSRWHRGNMPAYRLGPSLGILTALLPPRHRRITFLYDSGGVIEFGNNIRCYSQAETTCREETEACECLICQPLPRSQLLLTHGRVCKPFAHECWLICNEGWPPGYRIRAMRWPTHVLVCKPASYCSQAATPIHR
jgi:hypothetical protein